MAAEVAVPLQVGWAPVCSPLAISVLMRSQLGIGDGGLYTLWAGLTVLSELLILLVWWKGGNWRQSAIEREEAQSTSEQGRGRH